MLLQSCDYEVETAEKSAAALEKFTAAGDFALVISDMHLPGMDSLELIARLKQLKGKVPSIQLTGDDTSGRTDLGVGLRLSRSRRRWLRGWRKLLCGSER